MLYENCYAASRTTGGSLAPMTLLAEPQPDYIELATVNSQSTPQELLVKSAKIGKPGIYEMWMGNNLFTTKYVDNYYKNQSIVPSHI